MHFGWVRNPPKASFFSDFCNQGTKEGQGKIGNFAEKSEKIVEIWYNRLLVEYILAMSTNNHDTKTMVGFQKMSVEPQRK